MLKLFLETQRKIIEVRRKQQQTLHTPHSTDGSNNNNLSKKTQMQIKYN